MVAKPMKAPAPDRPAVEEQLRRITASAGMLHAESLCQLLTYLVEQALGKPGEHVKEYQIALDLFRRADSFDPRLDSTVRVQTSRLRNKLVEYYATAGAHDAVLIEIPKGIYTAVFHWRAPEPAPVAVPEPARAPRPPGRILAAAAVGGIALGLAMGAMLFRGPQPASAPDELKRFWSAVLKSAQTPLLVFSNAEFNGRPETGLRYFNPRVDSRDHINDLYTGVGEVLGIAELTKALSLLHRDVLLKRSGLLSWDETRNRDLIFVGSPTENLSLRDLPLASDFAFQPMPAGSPRPGDLAIFNEHPRPGEPPYFLASADLPLTEDYALLMLQPGLQAGGSVLLLAGTTTLGTQAAAEFVSQNEGLASLRKALGRYTPFSAVLRVRVARGVPVETRIAAIHQLGK